VLSLAAAALVFAGSFLLLPRNSHYLSGNAPEWVAKFPPPSAANSPETRQELDELLALQRTRTAAQVEAARADRKKDVSRFYAALGIRGTKIPNLPRLHSLIDNVEDDIGPYVRALKEKFRRSRPYVIEPRLEPCIDDVQDDLSYPSGHATYAYVTARLLADMVPERRDELTQRGEEFARQRMMCGVHFFTDIAAGAVTAWWLVDKLQASPEFRADEAAARRELREALGLRPLQGETRAAEAGARVR
jgi:acid phosphatase (class A)